MKFFKLLLNTFVILMLITAVRAQEDTTSAKRNNLLARKNNGRNTFGKPTTTTTTQEPVPQYDDEQPLEQQEGAEYDEEPLEVSSTTTTTEAPKLLRPLIKPFRSNDDLLNTLKRRQQNAKSGKPVTEKPRETDDDLPKPEAKPKSTKAATATGKRRSFGGAKATKVEPEVDEEDIPVASLKPSRSRFNQRSQN